MLKLGLGLVFFIGFLSAIAQPHKEISYERKFQALVESGSISPDTGIFFIKVKPGIEINKIPGVVVLRQLDQLHFIARSGIRLSNKDVVLQLPANSLWKASDNLLQEAQKATNRNLEIILVLKPESNVAEKDLRPAKTVKVHGNRIFVSIKSHQLRLLLNNPAIEFAELQRTPREETLINNLDRSVNQVNRVHSIYPLLTGKGITVSLKEERFDSDDLDLLGRTKISPTQSVASSAHATVMATLIGGNGNSFIKGLGAAPAVGLTSSDYKNLSPDPTGQLNALQVSVQNHSYGTGIENYYGIEAAEYDRQIFLADTLMHVFSAGNSGTATPQTGVYSGLANFSNLTGTFKQAKNVLVVGGTNNENTTEALSSAGPAYDGRIKPEIVAAGEDGTSGAAALTSGVVSLLQQQFKTKTGLQPSSALLKSVLINSADDLGNPNPDFKNGFGKLNAYQAVQTINENRFFSGSVSDGDDLVFPLEVNDPGEIKITLVWNDAAAPLNSPQALINDLDLWLEDAAGNKILPWVLSSFPHADSLGKPAIRKRDSLNNTEQITWQGATGKYKIHIAGRRLSPGKQDFYVSYQVKPSGKFEWTYPLSGDQLFAGEENYLRWESSLTINNGTVSVSFDNGISWSVISSLDINAGFVKWKSPDLLSQAIVKMSINGQDYITDLFSISKPLRLNVGYNCADGILLMWPKNPAAAAYHLYTIKNNVLQLLKTTADTTLKVNRQEISSDYYAVSPVHATGFEGLKSLTINAAAQGVGCYFQSLLADISPEKKILLSLKLGTATGLKNIRWEKQTGPSIFNRLAETPVNGIITSYTLTDINPKQGIQYYRVVLETLDGRQIISDLASVIYLDEYKFTLFPNPASRAFTVLSGTIDNFELSIYNSQGQKLRSEVLNNIRQDYHVEDLKQGIYICVISLKGKPIYRGKLIKI